MARSVGQTPVEKKRILVVDAFPMLRYGLMTFLNGQANLIVCGEADSIPSALIKIAECKPHLLVIGLRLAQPTAWNLSKRSRCKHPGCSSWCIPDLKKAFFPCERCARAQVVT